MSPVAGASFLSSHLLQKPPLRDPIVVVQKVATCECQYRIEEAKHIPLFYWILATESVFTNGAEEQSTSAMVKWNEECCSVREVHNQKCLGRDPRGGSAQFRSSYFVSSPGSADMPWWHAC